MIYQAFSIYDIKTAKYSMPMFVDNEADAKRNVIAAAKGQSMLAMFPGDYELFYIGEFDSADGNFTNIAPSKVCSVVDLIGDGN